MRIINEILEVKVLMKGKFLFLDCWFHLSEVLCSIKVMLMYLKVWQFFLNIEGFPIKELHT